MSANAKDRQDRIVELVRVEEFVSVERLAEIFDVTPQTIRRDIQILADEARVRRYRGGASRISSTENVDYLARQVMQLTEKRRIAAAVAAAIPNNSSLFLNIGTTTEEVAKALVNHQGLRIITNNLHVAAMLAPKTDFEVHVTSGVVRSRDGGIIGEATIDFVRQFRVDFGVIGISGIDIDGTLLDFDYREVQVARCMIEQSRRVILVADHSKVGRNALVRLGDLSLVDLFCTDSPLPSALEARAAEQDCEIRIA